MKYGISDKVGGESYIGREECELIDSVANAFLVYFLACFKVSRGLCGHINLLIRKL
jgi:hypothetical protein